MSLRITVMFAPFLFSRIAEVNGIQIRGILHAGAHLCEEQTVYTEDLGVPDEKILWLEANPELVAFTRDVLNIPNVYQAVLAGSERDIEFQVTNAPHSSSIYKLGTLTEHYPDIKVAKTFTVRSQTLDTFFKKNELSPSEYNVWVFDIQGAEYEVFASSVHLLKHVDMLVTEVALEEIYKGCGTYTKIHSLLTQQGFVRAAENITQYNWGDVIYVRPKNV